MGAAERGRSTRAPTAGAGAPRKTAAYRPRAVVLRNGRSVTLRAIRSEDAAEIEQAFQRLSPQSRYMRFMQHKKQLAPGVVERGTRPVAGREFAFVATVPSDDGYDIVGAVRYVQSSDPQTCEFSITVADDWTGLGLATVLMRSLIRRARYDGYRVMEGLVLAANDAMLALARRLKFRAQAYSGDRGVVVVRRDLTLRAKPGAARPPAARGRQKPSAKSDLRKRRQADR